MNYLTLMITIMTLSTLSLLVLRRWAIRYGFTDSPNQRKSHNGHIPLVGGLAVFLAITVVFLLEFSLLDHQMSYFIAAAVLVCVGFIDDIYDISVVIRLTILVAISSWLTLVEGVGLFYLGDLMGLGNVELSNTGAWVFSIFAITGYITSFNMIDGIDGLLGGTTVVVLIALTIELALSGRYSAAIFSLCFIAAIVPYILFNLGLKVKTKYKVFMGDSGSLLVGFTLVWLFIEATQPMSYSANNHTAMRPVTALWLAAVPLMDMVLVMIKRMLKKKSPFAADRTHLHHVLISVGLPTWKVLVLILSLSVVLAVVGLISEYYQVKESTMFFAFLQCFVLYSLTVSWYEKHYQSKVTISS